MVELGKGFVVNFELLLKVNLIVGATFLINGHGLIMLTPRSMAYAMSIHIALGSLYEPKSHIHTCDILPSRSTISAYLIRVSQTGSLIRNTHIRHFQQIG